MLIKNTFNGLIIVAFYHETEMKLLQDINQTHLKLESVIYS
jgi:hypothetical protein